MHVLFRLLYHIDKDINSEFNELSKEQYIESIKFDALQDFDHYYADAICDYHSEDAGGWSNEYPQNVIIGAYEPERLISELKSTKAFQEKEYKEAITTLKNSGINTDIENLWDIIQMSSDSRPKVLWPITHIGLYLSQRPDIWLGFLDLLFASSLVTDNTIIEATDHPEQFAMIIIDCHV